MSTKKEISIGINNGKNGQTSNGGNRNKHSSNLLTTGDKLVDTRAIRNRLRGKKTQEFRWDFDENDPYSVLDIRRGATKQEVSAAFRKQMLKYHPDTQPNASEAQKIRLVERSKIITEAYRRIKKEMQ
mmetsp:Transcript_59522/g.164639  ORF Transcript_59522/g.164639 Transcript_59522/m.164639 type:complete len:128 (+) Transcript_59522:606-989(+)